jgi:hypothetical protein
MAKPKQFRGTVELHHMGPNKKVTESIGFLCPRCDKLLKATFMRDDDDSDDVTFIVEKYKD